MNVNVRVHVEKAKIEAALPLLERRINAQLVHSARGLFRPLVPLQDGYLRRSAETHSLPEKGKLIYSTPYAKYQYYRRLRHTTPGTVRKWGEVGKRMYANQLKNIAATETRALLKH